MRKLICITLLIMVLVCSVLVVSNVHAASSVSGTIMGDTVWTKANSPYTLVGSVMVNSGVILNIEPGVTVDFTTYSLTINGALNVGGTSTDQVVFTTGSYSNVRIVFNPTSTPWNEATATGCKIENAVLNAVTVSFTNSSPKISNDYFTNSRYTSISGSGGFPLIVNNVFNCQTTAINLSGGSTTISGNFIKAGNISGSGYGIYSGTSAAYISNNNITGCYMGISSVGNVTITSNLITANGCGISITVSTGLIENNIITNNNVGIIGGGTIHNNTIANNNIGVGSIVTPCNVNQNNFFNNTQFTVGSSMSSPTDATYNWWSTTDAAAINQMIYDSKNSTTLGVVNFAPFLTAPNPQAPALENINLAPNPTPTPIPTHIPIPSPTPYLTIYPTPRANITINPQTPTPTPPQTLPTSPPYTATPLPTPTPTPKIMPGTALTLGSTDLTETLSQLDITEIAKLVLIGLGIMWIIVILVSVDRKFAQKNSKKPQV